MLEKYPNIYVVADEIYEHINFDEKHFSIGSIASMKEKTITVNGVSKGFAMTGWRVGFIEHHNGLQMHATKYKDR